ncbi:MAG: AMIN domain-containing protein [Candidatus Sulfotelmatobacter sp.]
MKLTTGILATVMMAGGSWAAVAAQNPDAIDNARSIAKSLQQKQANDTNAALDAAGVPAAKPAPGAPAPAVKPAAIPGSKPVMAAAPAPAAQPAPAAKPASAAKPAQASAGHNQLQRVSVVPGTDGIEIEISSSQAVTPRVSKLNSPARLVVELPETSVGSAQTKIPVGTAGVKGVRVGMDGKTPPTTSVVVDLEQAVAYELTPGPAGKVILTLHSSEDSAPSVAKNSSASAAKAAVATAKPPVAAPKVAVAKAPASKPVAAASKPEAKQQAKAAPAAKPAVAAASAPEAAPTPAKPPKPEDKKWAMNGKRDPFFSPVVQQQGSGCSTGKKCLEIGAINLRGVVKSDTGFIAVVTNNLNKAYFLRENDPVFNGYVVKITGDSVVFQETIQDKLGKPFTREVVKRIFTPAV